MDLVFILTQIILHQIQLGKMKNTVFIFIISLFTLQLVAQDCSMHIGTNLPSADEQVFKDLKLSSTHFFTRNLVYLADDPNDWDTGLINEIPTDANGYPTIDVPFSHPSVDTTQTYHFITAISGIYPTGHYALTFDGSGVISISDWSNAENITQINSNRIEFDVFTTSETGIHVEIMESSASDYIRNIQIVHQNDWDSFEEQPFRDEFVQLANNFTCIRFMDWMATNKLYYDAYEPYDANTLTWQERVPAQYHRQNREEEGMAYEYVIELANHLQKDIWINIPHQADTTYIRNMAELFYNNMNAQSTVYVEFSNEVWNSIFQQTDYVEGEGPYPNDIGRNLGWFANRAFTIWENVYGVDRNRLKLVIAGHDWICVDALSVMEVSPDVASYPGYFNMSESQWNELSAMGASASINDIVSRALTNMQNEDFYWMNEFKELVCDAHDLDFVMYEGGQHLLRYFGVAETFQDVLYQTQQSPEMYELYTELLTYCRDELDVKLFNHFTLFGPNENVFGSWGMVASVYETPNTPKYNALMDFACNDAPPVGIDSINTTTNITVYPNPTSEWVHFKHEQSQKGTLTLLDATGRIVYQQVFNGMLWKANIENLAKGLYLYNLQLNTTNTSLSGKIIK